MESKILDNLGRQIDEVKMIIIITGASHVGKTLLAQRMLEKYKYPYLSIDHLKMGLIRSGYTDLTPEDDNELTDYLWPIRSDYPGNLSDAEVNWLVKNNITNIKKVLER